MKIWNIKNKDKIINGVGRIKRGKLMLIFLFIVFFILLKGVIRYGIMF